ncbi:amidohydrolase family protein [Haladaptatus halobius]|uniref:amidohydrolase family protein n=1 Tax=Haladaptatus halobius TaxID=2884875 RepID=UPI001D0A7CC6|nr:amidohydrolase family protein [Haladaptatus halobius]
MVNRETIDIWCNLTTPACTEQFDRSAFQETADVINKPNLFERISCSLDELVDRMDSAGVTKALIPSLKFGNEAHDADPVDLSVETVREACKTYPDRFEGLVGIDPTNGMDGVRELEQAVENYGFVGAMVVPYGFGYPPNHRRYYPFYAKCAELGVPVSIQVGHTAVKMSNEYGRPQYIEDICLEFPELDIIALNIGWPWTSEIIAQVWTYPNLYLATTGHAPQYWGNELVNFIRNRGRDKVMWGTNYPFIRFETSINQIEELNLMDDVGRMLLSQNAKAVYRL